jgi:hypothetical protein
MSVARLLAILMLAFLVQARAEAEEASFIVLFFDLDASYGDAQAKLAGADKMLKGQNPDIAIFAGVEGAAFIDELKRRNLAYKFLFRAKSAGPGGIMLLSRLVPSECVDVQRIYNIRNDRTGLEQSVDVGRAFIKVDFAVSDYSFTLLVADVKDRTPHPELNQFDMRRYEIRQIRYVFDEIIKKKPDSNVLVVGNFNDTCDMSTIKEIYARRYGNKKRLFDIRPVDDLNTSWTSWSSDNDEYERTSYALASHSMLPEIQRDSTRLLRHEEWPGFSRHRPLLLRFTASEMEEHSDQYLATIYPNSIYSERAAHFERERIIGEKPKRKPPTPPQKKDK